MVENDSANKNLLNDNRQGNAAVIVPASNAKVQPVTPAQTKTLQHLPKRPPVDLAFHNLTYRVKEGNRSSKYYIRETFLSIFCNLIIQVCNVKYLYLFVF